MVAEAVNIALSAYASPYHRHVCNKSIIQLDMERRQYIVLTETRNVVFSRIPMYSARFVNKT